MHACVRVVTIPVFHLQCSLFELMLNVLVHSYGHVFAPILWDLYPKFSPLCLVWVRTPLWPCEPNQVLLASVSDNFVFLGVLPFSSHLLIGASHMSCNNHERDVKRNKKNEPLDIIFLSRRGHVF